MEYDVGKEITNLSNQIKRNMGILSKKTGLSGTQGHVLHFIIVKEKEGLIQKDIEEEFNLRPATATGILKNLERDGYIIRTPSKDDARHKTITLDQKSLAISSQIAQEVANFDRQLTSDLSPEEITTLIGLLGRISGSIPK
ncbi:MAG: MarR family transcriptional regulator [Erysipelotrichaceae bacterium]|nr:MarR family transcriptional regulator [Erysipelotrichaceae bacterium]MDD3809705.1 MarR family transcriptional regulator [Erysipelotrichaceae bacterium]